MNQENETLLNQGISAVRGGNKREGARILAQVVRSEPQSDDAWFWLAAATDQPGEAKACLDRVLKINPSHTRARQALDVINQSGGTMPATSAFTGESMPSPYGAPPPPSRPINANELISPASGFGASPYGAPPSSPGSSFPPPPPFGSSPSGNTVSMPPPPFGNSPSGSTMPMPPPSPFGNPPSGNTVSMPPPPFGNSPSGSTVPAPPPFGSSPSGSTVPAPPPFGNSPSGGNTVSMPPPPFGVPAWAQDQGGGNPTRPSLTKDPYGANAPTSPSLTPPPANFTGGGLRFGQLDPAAAAAQASQAVIEEQAGPKIYDPGAEIRRSLLGDPPAPPPTSPNTAPTTPNPAITKPPVVKAKKTGKKNNQKLLLIIVAALVLMTAAVAALKLGSNSTTPTPTIVATTEQQTATAVADLTVTAVASVSPNGTPLVTPSVAEGTNSVVVTTTEATVTLEPATTPPASTTEVSNNAATTSAPTSTRIVPIPVPSDNAATVSVPTSTRIVPIPVPSGNAATASVPTSTRIAPIPVPSGKTTSVSASPTSSPGSVITIPVPSRTATITSNVQVPSAVQQYVNDANNLINSMAFIETQVNGLVTQPYKDGKFKAGVPLSKTYEISYFTLLMGQLAAQFRQLNPPNEAFSLSQIGLDYSSDIREAGINMDNFFDTGRITYLDQASTLMTKAAADRNKWFQTLQAGYPFKVTF